MQSPRHGLSQQQAQALAELRVFLEQCWDWSHMVYYDTGFNRGEAKPAIASSYMCRHTSRLLLDLMGQVDDSWRLGGGEMATNDGRAAQAHWWIENDDTIVDLTADQFGWEKVVVAPIDDARYMRLPGAEHRSNINRLGTTIDQWKGKPSRDWMEQDASFKALAKASPGALAGFCQAWVQPGPAAGDACQRGHNTRPRMR